MRKAIFVNVCVGVLMLLQACSEETITKVGLKGTLQGSLKGAGSITGLSPLAGATVVFEGSEPLITLQTDSDGKFQTGDLVTGTYNIVFTKEGYGTYKILGYSFVGGDFPAILTSVTLYKLPTIQISDATVTINRFFDTVSASYKVTVTDQGNNQSYSTQFRYFISTEADVSSTKYQDTGILGYYYQPGTVVFNRNLSLETYPAGSTIYVIIYPCTDPTLSYLDLETGKSIYSSLGASKSPVLKIVMPN